MIQEQHDQALFDEIAGKYAQKDVVPSSSIARKGQLLAALSPILSRSQRLGTVVDIGCGVGAPAAYLSDGYDRYIGVDQSEEMCKAGSTFNRRRTAVEYIADNIKTVDIPDNTADLVLSIGALHHMTKLDQVMASLVRIAKPGAYLVVIEPQNGNPLIQLMRWLRGLVDKGYSTEQIFFSEQQLSALFARHGIADLQVNFQGFFSPPFALVILPPQVLTSPLSRLAVRADAWLNTHLPRPLSKLSFNIVLTGKFTKPHNS